MFTLGPKVSYATTTLKYPIFAAEFDPYNRGYLVVGGGGGEAKSGVPNQISVLDVSNRATISSIVDIELSRDEDSVQSLASLATKDGLITFAGINSSQADQNAGANEHFRSFEIKIPPRKKQKTDTEEKGTSTLVGTRSLFKPESSAKKEAYQRILRLSPAQRREAGSKRIGAIASGMSKPSEIIVFSATAALPATNDILTRIETEKNSEVADLDIAVADQDRFSVAWCTDHEICEQTFEYDFNTKKVQKEPKGPRRIHQVPILEGAAATAPRPKFRCLRFLDHENILALVNKPGKTGAELHVYHLYPTGPASTTLQMTLPSHVKQAVSMDVCILDTDASSDRQIVVAVAAQDISIETYVLNFRSASGTFSRFHEFQTFRDVHKHQMTKLCFSPFHAPAEGSKQEQFIRLASVTYGNSVVVDTLPLVVFDSKDPKSRHVLLHPSSQKQQRYLMIALLSFMVLVAAFVGRAYLTGEADIKADLRSFWEETYSDVFAPKASTVQDIAKEMQSSAASIVNSVVPTSIPGQETASSLLESVVPIPSADGLAEASASVSSVVADAIPSEVPGLTRLQDLLNLHPEETKAIVISDHPEQESISLAVHDDKQEYMSTNADAVHWDELKDEQKHYWRKRLVQAGQWTEHEGEAVLKSILWSQYAGLVGAAAGEILREL